MRTLIVDDNPLMRDTLRSILESLGAHVTDAADGNLGISRLDEALLPFELIVCDLRMPNRDGIQFLRALAERDIRAGIILISGHQTEVLSAAANIGRRHALNIIGHLKKPFGRSDLRELLHGFAARDDRPVAPRIDTPVDEADIRRGLAAGEITVVFQPKVDCTSYEIVGAEALIRWHHSRLGPIPPGIFVPVAEANSLIDTLTEFVLGEALSLHLKLGLDGPPVPIAVNLSTRSMDRLDFADRLAAIVNSRGATPSAITFEVTESRLADNTASLIETCARLRLMGFKLAIDDFGTGFSTLEQLRLLPVSELKIDRAFVGGAPADSRARSILEASLVLGAKLGLACVCEGVETRAEWDLIRSLGHHIGQGYFIARPMPATDLIAWMGTWRTRAAGGTVA